MSSHQADLTPGARRILDTRVALVLRAWDPRSRRRHDRRRGRRHETHALRPVRVEGRARRAYLQGRDQRWLALRAEAVDAAGPDPIDRLRAVFDASAGWSDTDGGRGCGFTNAHAEFSDPTHPVAALVTAQKRELLDLFRGILADAGVTDGHVAEAVLALHEGALVAHGVGVGADPWVSAREAAVRLAGG